MIFDKYMKVLIIVDQNPFYSNFLLYLYITQNIDEIVSDPKFRDLVQEDAKAILNRQETDSVDIIDEIRYVLRTCNLSTSGMDMGAMVSS